MSDSEYIPGVCNIGGAEVRLRNLVGWAGLIGAIALWSSLAWAKSPPAARLWVGGPALMSAIGFLQARWGFCVNYGLGGVSSFGRKAGETTAVEDEKAREMDRSTSWRIIGESSLIAAVVAILAYLLPAS